MRNLGGEIGNGNNVAKMLDRLKVTAVMPAMMTGRRHTGIHLVPVKPVGAAQHENHGFDPLRRVKPLVSTFLPDYDRRRAVLAAPLVRIADIARRPAKLREYLPNLAARRRYAE